MRRWWKVGLQNYLDRDKQLFPPPPPYTVHSSARRRTHSPRRIVLPALVANMSSFSLAALELQAVLLLAKVKELYGQHLATLPPWALVRCCHALRTAGCLFSRGYDSAALNERAAFAYPYKPLDT